MSEKKFANLHYPGMKADPTESGTKRALPPEYLWRFESQMAVLGEIAQRKILDASVLILGSTPLGVTVARKLLGLGVGRLGVFSDEPLTGAHGFGKLEGETSSIKALGKLVKTEFPWVEFEPFSSLSVDRQLDDILRGFKIVVSVLPDASISKEAAGIFLSPELNGAPVYHFLELTALTVTQKIFEKICGPSPLDHDAFCKLAKN